MTTKRDDFDVAVVGASIAGCATAIGFARAGLRVALIERRPDPAAYKTLCSHFIQSSAVPAIERLGLLGDIEAAGAVRPPVEMSTPWGWIRARYGPDAAPLALSIRRQVLDPLLRRVASDSPGVEPMLGRTAVGLLPGARGVEVEDRRRARRQVSARLVVAADGRSSPVAALAGVDKRETPIGRIAYFAYYRGVPGGDRARFWLGDPEIGYVLPTDGGLSALAVMATKDHLPRFKADLESAFGEYLAALPEAPVAANAERVTPFYGFVDRTCVARAPAARGIALVGDAALASDPLWGIGCGWAFQSAEWLVQSTAASLAAGADPRGALARYARRHRRALRGHERLNVGYTSGRRFNPVERLMFSAAARDQGMADHVEAFASRRIPVRRFLGPGALARAAAVNVRHAYGSATSTRSSAFRGSTP
jgi:2-polyprenyl-6-methoxyphenol hydroxylase-like FAD-dependent oxidoreductase